MKPLKHILITFFTSLLLFLSYPVNAQKGGYNDRHENEQRGNNEEKNNQENKGHEGEGRLPLNNGIAILLATAFVLGAIKINATYQKRKENIS